MISICVFVVATRMLTKTDLATYRQTILAYEMVLPLLGLGLSQGIYYLLPTATERLRGIAFDAATLLMIAGGAYSVFMAIGGSEFLALRFSNPAISTALLYLLPLPVFALLATLVSPILIVRESVNTLVGYKMATQIITGLGILLACAISKRPIPMLVVYVVLTILGSVIGIHLVLRALPRDSWQPRLTGISTLVCFGLPIGAATMIGSINKQADRVIVAVLGSPEEFAVYVVGAFELPLVGIVTASVSSVILVDMRKAIEAGELRKAQRLFSKAARRISVYLIPFMCFVLATAPLLITVLFSARYLDSADVLRVYMLKVPMQIILTGAAFVSLGMSSFILKRTVVSFLFNLVLSIILYQWLGPIGVAWATIISGGIIAFVWNLPVLAKKLNVRLFNLYPFGLLGKELLAAGVPAVGLWVVLLKNPTIIVLSMHIMLLVLTAMVIFFFIFYYVVGKLWFPSEFVSFKEIRR